MMNGRPRILLISAGTRHTADRLHPLEAAGFDLVHHYELDNTRNEALLAAALDGAWATIAGSEAYTRTVLEQAPSLRAIARFGVGYDGVDVPAATEQGIVVLTAPGGNADSVADFALTLMLGCLRRLLATDEAVRSGEWRRTELAGDLASATVGIVGLGRIGRAVASRVAGFGCRILAVESAPDLEFCARSGIELGALDEVLPEIDVLTLHVPLTAETRHLIGARELALMRPTAIVVNTSRGGVIDETALIAALASGGIGGAGLDVFEVEPLPVDHPLGRLPNVVLGGHVSTFTGLSVQRTTDEVVASLLELHGGRLPSGCVNPEALQPVLGGGGTL
jgi:D-3-phosphoglycerate dehydrogenase/(S)-sulfolactate dehydrogenase